MGARHEDRQITGTSAPFSEKDPATRVPVLLNIKTDNKTISQIFFTE
jgi:hypothetical protein